MADSNSPKKRSVFEAIGGGLKDMLVREIPGEDEASAKVPPLPPTSSIAGTSVTSPAQELTSAAVEKSKKALLDAMTENKLESYDYLKFKSSIQELASDIPEERLRYKTVFATAKTLGISKGKLVETAEHYVLVLDEELKKFNQAVNDQVRDLITKNEAKLQDLNGAIASAQMEIKALNDHIASFATERDALAAKIAGDKTTIESNKCGFVAAHGALVQDIQTDISKLSSYLG